MTSPYPFTPKIFPVDGHRLSYLDEGKGPVIVMLHGNPTWSFYYRNMVLALRSEFRVIVPDHIGCGLSDKPLDYPYTLATHIANLTELIRHLGLHDISLMVHDWGGAIGMGFAGRHPEMIRSLVISNTAAFLSARIPWRIWLCRLPWLGALLVRGLNGFAGAAITMAVTKKMPADVAQGYLQPYDSWRNRVAVYAFVRDIPLAKSHVSWQTLAEVEGNLPMLQKKPLLILWGGKDFCFDDWFYREWLRRFPKARRHYFAEAGHYLLEDAGPEVVTMARNFFRETTPHE
ncbi:MAG: alpha/beta fold hydrolase [Desulfobulbaceae bacterium]|nr:alpha/beta fold hydrolase [Desulfobulbaceae bacterium]